MSTVANTDLFTTSDAVGAEHIHDPADPRAGT